jgi:hypothetical protein
VFNRGLRAPWAVDNHISRIDEANWRVCMQHADGQGHTISIGPYRTQQAEGIGIAHIGAEIDPCDLIPRVTPKIVRDITRLLLTE